MNNIFEIEKDYKKEIIRVTKYSEFERTPVSEISIDMRNRRLLFKEINVLRKVKFKEPREEDIYYFDYGYDSTSIYRELSEFCETLGYDDINFYSIRDNMGLPIVKYLKLKVEHSSIDEINTNFNDELVLYNKKLKDMSIIELKSYFSRLDKERFLRDMFDVDEELFHILSVNKENFLDYLYYAEFFNDNLNYSKKVVTQFYKLLSDLSIIKDYKLFMKFIEILRYASDIYMVNDFLIYSKNKRYSLDTIDRYVTSHIKKCRREFNNKEKLSSNILSELQEEENLKTIGVKDESVIENRINQLLELFSLGDLVGFSELLLSLKEIYTEDDFSILDFRFKEEFSKIINNTN